MILELDAPIGPVSLSVRHINTIKSGLIVHLYSLLVPTKLGEANEPLPGDPGHGPTEVIVNPPADGDAPPAV